MWLVGEIYVLGGGCGYNVYKQNALNFEILKLTIMQ